MNKTQRAFYLASIACALFLISLFAVWWFNPSHLSHNKKGTLSVSDVLLFALVTYVIWHPIAMIILKWSIASHIRQHKAPKPQKGLNVAVITTFVPRSESISLLHKTLPSLVAIEYEHDTWLLDEGNDPKVIEICEMYGVKHFSRFGDDNYNQLEGKFARKTKGGNHNSWYDKYGKTYDIVAQMDTDFIAHKDYLTKTLGHFKDKDVAFVGTPQVYGNVDKSIIARGAAEQTYSFYGPLLRGMDGMETTLLIGANHVIRVAALRHVDFYSAHITEDLLTGMKLHANGWKSVYVPEALAIGEGPTDWKAYFRQQKRWAYGCMHILFRHSPLLFRKMKIRRALYYFLIQQHYFSGLATAIGFALTTSYFLFGTMAADINLTSFVLAYAPVLAISAMINLWLQRFNVRPEERGIMWAAMYVQIAAWPVFFMAFLNLFKTKKLVYQVTPKGKKVRTPNAISLDLFAPHFFIGIISLVSVITSFYSGRHAAVMVFWAVINTVFMFMVPIVTPLMKYTSRVGRLLNGSFERAFSRGA